MANEWRCFIIATEADAGVKCEAPGIAFRQRFEIIVVRRLSERFRLH